MNLARCFMMLLICTGLAGCAHTAPPEQVVAEKVILPSLPLLTPASALSTFSASQTLTFTSEGQTHQLEALLEWDSDAIHLAMLKFGKRILTATYDGVKLDVQKDAFVPDALRGEQVLGDIQLVYWPAEALRTHLPPGYVLNDEGDLRTLSYLGQNVYRIVYHADGRADVARENNVRLTQFIYGYEMTIVSNSN
jgi:hypothetical protein